MQKRRERDNEENKTKKNCWFSKTYCPCGFTSTTVEETQRKTSVFWININLNYYFDYYLLNIIIEHYLVIELWLKKREWMRRKRKKKNYI